MFGNWNLITRIDRDTVPLFFTSTAAEADTGTGGGIVADYPQVRQGWSGNKLGDLWLGGKVNLLAASTKPLGLGIRGQIKLPVGDEESGASSGATDFQFDGIVSSSTNRADVSGYVRVHGPRQSRRLRADQRASLGLWRRLPGARRLKFTAELFGEQLLRLDDPAPAAFIGSGRFYRSAFN